MPTYLAIFLIVLPILIFLGGLIIWAKYFLHRIGVTPVMEPMLRGPGESQRKRIEELNENMLEWLMLASFPPILCAVTYFQIAQYTVQSLPTVITLSLMSFGMVAFAAYKLVGQLRELRNRRLGYAGECVVAERLQPVLAHGFLVFHDCPADEHGNIDHIVVTPTKVYAIETKTRRKRLSPETHRYEAVVTYDGKGLIYPHGRETWGLDQSRRQARWLSQLLSEALCEKVLVQPVLALPGWYVRRSGRGDVAVLNPKSLPALLREPTSRTVPRPLLRRMEQIRFVLEGRCRDVPFPGVLTAQEARKAASRALQKKKAAAARARAASSISTGSAPLSAGIGAR